MLNKLLKTLKSWDADAKVINNQHNRYNNRYNNQYNNLPHHLRIIQFKRPLEKLWRNTTKNKTIC
jgi:hypothetical protein